MNGEKIAKIYEQLDDRGRHLVEVVALAELKHTREGLQTADKATLESQTCNLPMEHENDQIEGRDDKN